MTTAAPDVEELAQRVYGDDPRCEMVFVCDEHGDEHCGSRARWVAMVQCPDGGHPNQILACDECHDGIETSGNRLGTDDHVVSWRAL